MHRIFTSLLRFFVICLVAPVTRYGLLIVPKKTIRPRGLTPLAVVAAGLVSLFAAENCDAAIVQWTIAPNESSLTILAIKDTGATILPQGAGSLLTTIGGNLDTAIMPGGSIQILSAAVVVAINGAWIPDAALADVDQAANLGYTADFAGNLRNAAVRGLTLDVTSVSIGLDVVGPDSYEFSIDTPNSAIEVTGGLWHQGALGGPLPEPASATPLVGTGSFNHAIDLFGGPVGTVETTPGNWKLILPIAWDSPLGPIFSGTIVAYAAPEPSALALAAFGLVGLAAWGWRRRKRSRA